MPSLGGSGAPAAATGTAPRNNLISGSLVSAIRRGDDYHAKQDSEDRANRHCGGVRSRAEFAGGCRDSSLASEAPSTSLRPPAYHNETARARGDCCSTRSLPWAGCDRNRSKRRCCDDSQLTLPRSGLGLPALRRPRKESAGPDRSSCPCRRLCGGVSVFCCRQRVRCGPERLLITACFLDVIRAVDGRQGWLERRAPAKTPRLQIGSGAAKPYAARWRAHALALSCKYPRRRRAACARRRGAVRTPCRPRRSVRKFRAAWT